MKLHESWDSQFFVGLPNLLLFFFSFSLTKIANKTLTTNIAIETQGAAVLKLYIRFFLGRLTPED